MPWKNQGGGPWGSGPKGPWGSGPQSPGPRPPDLEDLLRRGQDKLQTMLPGGNFSGMGIALVLVARMALPPSINVPLPKEPLVGLPAGPCNRKVAESVPSATRAFTSSA